MSEEEGKVSSLRVISLGLALIGFGAVGFHEIPGMISETAEGSKIVNAIYCSVMTLTTVGFGDICPGDISGPGRTFLVALAFSGLGMFCGPIMDLTSSWHETIGGKVALLSVTMLSAVFVFCYLLEEMSESEAAYFSIITGTTIGYGDIHPKTDAGKLAVALYAIVAINAVGSLLQPAKEVLHSLCKVQDDNQKKKTTTTKSSGYITDMAKKAKVDEEDDADNAGADPKKKKKKKKNTKGNSTTTKKDQ